MRHLARTGCGVLPLMRYIADSADDIGKSLPPSVRPEWRRRRCIEGSVPSDRVSDPTAGPVLSLATPHCVRPRSEHRRVRKESLSKCSFWSSQYQYTKKKTNKHKNT